MEPEKIKSIKLALMQLEEVENIDPSLHNFIIRSSIFFSLKDAKSKIEYDDVQYLISDMYKTLLQKTVEFNGQKYGVVNYVGIWVDYDGEMFRNHIHMNTLRDMSMLSTDHINPIYELLKLTLPDG